MQTFGSETFLTVQIFLCFHQIRNQMPSSFSWALALSTNWFPHTLLQPLQFIPNSAWVFFPKSNLLKSLPASVWDPLRLPEGLRIRHRVLGELHRACRHLISPVLPQLWVLSVPQYELQTFLCLVFLLHHVQMSFQASEHWAPAPFYSIPSVTEQVVLWLAWVCSHLLTRLGSSGSDVQEAMDYICMSVLHLPAPNFMPDT